MALRKQRRYSGRRPQGFLTAFGMTNATGVRFDPAALRARQSFSGRRPQGFLTPFGGEVRSRLVILKAQPERDLSS